MKFLKLFQVANKQLENEKLLLAQKIEENSNQIPDHHAYVQLKNANKKLSKQIDQYRLHCAWTPPAAADDEQQNNYFNEISAQKSIDVNRNFDAQIPVSENLYKITINNANHTITTTTATTSTASTSSSFLSPFNRMFHNNSDVNSFKRSVHTSGVGGGVVDIAKGYRKIEGGGVELPTKIFLEGVINSVENFQIVPQPLAYNREVIPQPPSANDVQQQKQQKTSSTMSSDKKSPSDVVAAAGNKLQNAPMPTATPNNNKKLSSTTAATIRRKSDGKTKHRPVPEGVVPVPPKVPDYDLVNGNGGGGDGGVNGGDGVQNENQNDRYKNVLVDSIGGGIAIDTGGLNGVAAADDLVDAKVKIADGNDDIKYLHDNDLNNGANEVMDGNDFQLDGTNIHKNHLQNEVVGAGNNAAEDDTNYKGDTSGKSKVNDDDGVGLGNGIDENKDRDSIHKNKNNQLNVFKEAVADQGNVYQDEPHPGEGEAENEDGM